MLNNNVPSGVVRDYALLFDESGLVYTVYEKSGTDYIVSSVFSGDARAYNEIASNVWGIGYLVNFDAVVKPNFDTATISNIKKFVFGDGTSKIHFECDAVYNGANCSFVYDYELDVNGDVVGVEFTYDTALFPEGYLQYASFRMLTEAPAQPEA
jgi:hypothetical protein